MSPGDLRRLAVPYTLMNDNQKTIIIMITEKQRNQKWKKRQVLGPCQWPKKLWKVKVTIIRREIGALGTVPKGLIRGQEGVGNQRTNRYHSSDSITKSGNNNKSRGDLRRFAVTEISGKTINHRWYENWQELIIIIMIMDISCDKLAKSYMRSLGHGYKRET